MPPSLFYFYFMYWYLCDVSSVVTLESLCYSVYIYGRKLVGDRTAKFRLLTVRINESQFADDLALYAVDCTMFEPAGRKFVLVGSQFGLTVSIPKTKGLAMGAINEGDVSPIADWKWDYLDS